MKRTETEHSLFIERRFEATPQEVWDAWTTPDLFVRWFGPRDWPAVEVSQDVKRDGLWRAVLQSDSGEQLVAAGRYIKLDPPKHLCFTFRWESDNHEDGTGVETIVNVWLNQSGSGTHMKFEQRGLVSKESATGHTGGWNSTFDRLEALFTTHKKNT